MPDINDGLEAAGLAELPRSIWLEIDLAALTNNVAVVREVVGPKVEITAVVKADAYGHGLKQTALAFEAAGADRLAVASLDEALTLRTHRDSDPDPRALSGAVLGFCRGRARTASSSP